MYTIEATDVYPIEAISLAVVLLSGGTLSLSISIKAIYYQERRYIIKKGGILPRKAVHYHERKYMINKGSS